MPTVQEMIRQVPCPACGAESGKKCFRNDRQGTKKSHHNERIVVYKGTLASPVKSNTEWRERYNAYITKSATWQDKRNERLALDGNRCQGCGSLVNLNVHHLNYRRLGNEQMRDLVTVCETCHEKIHRLARSVPVAKATATFLARKRKSS
jgi:hypothetical protein